MQTLIRAARIQCLLDERTAVAVDDVRRVARPALRHRVLLNFEGEAESLDVDALLSEILETVPAPGDAAA